MPHQIPRISPTVNKVVEARALRKVYGEGDAQVVALDTVSLTITEGEFVAIMGPSGSGKSTLLHCMAGLDTPTSGSVFIAGQDLSGMKDKQLTTVRRDQLGFIFQSFNLLPTLTAEENILLPQRLARRKPDQDWYDAVISVLGLSERLTHRPNELSGGQQQRVAVARALVGRPKVIFADEPPVPWTPPQPPTCFRPSPACARPWARPSSWSPTTNRPQPPPTASSAYATDASSATTPSTTPPAPTPRRLPARPSRRPSLPPRQLRPCHR